MWRTAETNRWGLIVEDLAIICGNCGARLRIVQTRMALAQFALFAGPIGAAWCCAWLVAGVYKSLDRRVVGGLCFLVYVALSATLQLRYARYVPLLVRLRLLRDDETAQFPNPKTVAKSHHAHGSQ